MQRLSLLLVLLLTACFAHGKEIVVYLAGDSTLAPGSGYGDALCGRFATSVTCRNMAKGGRSTMSYRDEGSWAEVLAELSAKRGFFE